MSSGDLSRVAVGVIAVTSLVPWPDFQPSAQPALVGGQLWDRLNGQH